MADDLQGSNVVEGADTPAPAEPVAPVAAEPQTEPQTGASEPNVLENADPWAKFGQDEASDTQDSAEKPAEGDAKEGEKPADAAADGKTEEKDEETKILEELIAAETPIEPEKTQEQKDAELDAQDPAAMEAGQRNAIEKAYLQRTQRFAKPMRDLKLGTIEPAEALRQLEPYVGSDKIAALKKVAAHELVDSNPDATFQRAYVAKMLAKDPAFDYTKAEIPSLDDLVNGRLAPVQEQSRADMPELEALTKELGDVLDFDWRDPANDHLFVDDRELAMAKALRGLESRAKAEGPDLAAARIRLAELEKAEADRAEADKAKTVETVSADVEHQTSEAISNYQVSVEERLMPMLFKKNQLLPDPADTPEIAALKARKVELYTGDETAKELGQPSAFENFAYYRSSVAKDLVKIVTSVVGLQRQYAVAKVAKDEAKMAEIEALAQAERLPIMTYLIQADKEFYNAYVKPDMDLAVKSARQVVDPLKQAGARIEVVSNAGSAPSNIPKRREAETADDVWNRMAEEAAAENTAIMNA